MKSDDCLIFVRKNCGIFDVPLIMSFCQTESSFNERAFARDRNGGSFGLMQLDVPTARDRGFKGDPAELFDPETNIRLGVAQLCWIDKTLKRTGAGGLQNMIAAYNEGVTNVLCGNPDPLYVGNVIQHRTEWARILGEGVP